MVCLYGCGEEETAGPDGDPFVLLVYIAADNDLSGEAAQKLEALRHGFDGQANARVFVYTDSAGEAPRLVELSATDEGTLAVTVAEYPEQNSASAPVLAGVIEQVRGTGPASGYGLLLFSHASGWLPAGALSDPGGVTYTGGAANRAAVPGSRTVGRDGTDEMELADFAAAFPDGLFDYIVFEACYMAGIEVMHLLRDKADYIVASAAEIVSPGFTNIYPEALPMLLAGSGGVVPFARAAFDHYDAKSGWERSATFSVIQTAGIPALVEFLRSEVGFDGGTDGGDRVSRADGTDGVDGIDGIDGVDGADVTNDADGAALMDAAAGSGSVVGMEGADLTGVQYFDRNSRHLFFDLADACGRVLDAEQAARLETLIGDCVVWQAATPTFLSGYSGFAVATHCGLTTYWPQSDFPGLNLRWYEIMR
ncbi:MAG: clostripain-related cysteine peptidase [Rikenellaceae bacterium]|nr:clostripain-related cysteine peptidase [Rikenellaceae bacterium]